MSWHVTVDGESYEVAREGFSWDVPAGYNIAHDLVRKHENPNRVALFQADPDGRRETYTFADLDSRSNRLAAYEYPRVIEFVDELPTTTTGKIQRRTLRDRATDGDA